EKLHLGDFGGDTHAFELAFFTATAGCEGQKILIVQVFLYFVKIRSEGDRPVKRQIIGFGPGFFGESAEICLRVEDAEEASAQMAGAGIINRPYIHVFLLRALDGGIQIGIDRIETAAEIIDSGRNEDDRGAMIT